MESAQVVSAARKGGLVNHIEDIYKRGRKKKKPFLDCDLMSSANSAKPLIHVLNIWGHSLANMLYTNYFVLKVHQNLPNTSHTTKGKIRYFVSNITFRNFKHINPSTNRHSTFIHLNIY